MDKAQISLWFDAINGAVVEVRGEHPPVAFLNMGGAIHPVTVDLQNNNASKAGFRRLGVVYYGRLKNSWSDNSDCLR